MLITPSLHDVVPRFQGMEGEIGSRDDFPTVPEVLKKAFPSEQSLAELTQSNDPNRFEIWFSVSLE